MIETPSKQYIMDLANTVRKYIEQNRLQEAITAFMEWATTQKQEDIRQQLSLHKQRFTTVKKHENIGIITYADAMRERTTIGYALLELLKEIENIKQDLPVERGINDKKSILFLASNPSSTAQLQLEKEFVQISKNLQDSPQFRVVSEWAITPTKLQGAILKYKPSFVHFSGHGTSQDGSVSGHGRGLAARKHLSQSGIVLQDEKGESKVVSGAKLTAMFSIFVKNFPVEVVLLNACYSEEQARMISACIPYVVGMSDSVEDDAAISFSNAFYNNMAMGANIELAFELAKSNVSMDDYNSGVLALYKNGALYVE